MTDPDTARDLIMETLSRDRGHPQFRCHGTGIEYDHTCPECGLTASFASADLVCRECFDAFWGRMMRPIVGKNGSPLFVGDWAVCPVAGGTVIGVDHEAGTVTVHYHGWISSPPWTGPAVLVQSSLMGDFHRAYRLEPERS